MERKENHREGETCEKTEVHRNYKILAMDDDPWIQEALEELFKKFGHQAVLVKNGEEALREYSVASDSEEPFDLVILDLVIPGGIGGIKTLKNLRKKDPNVVAIVSSGYGEETSEGFNAKLPKPYKLETLRDTIQTVMRK